MEDRSSKRPKDMTKHALEPRESCPICLEEFGAGDERDIEQGAAAQEAITLTPCAHSFCRLCLNEYIRLAVVDRRVPIPCPKLRDAPSCGDHISEDIVKSILLDDHCQSEDQGSGNQVWSKFERFSQVAKDPLLVVCPWCDGLVSQAQDNKDPNLLCQSCDKNFCALHGKAHMGTSCQEYKKTKAARDIEKSEKVVLRWTKPCSRCSARIYKASGCDHVVCPSCKEDMCFGCGTHIHLSGKMTRSCAKCQQGYLDHRYNCRYRVRLCLYLPLFLPVVLLYVVIGILIAAITLCYGCCFGCGYCVPGRPSELAPIRGAAACLGIVFLPLISLLGHFGVTCTFAEGGDADRGSIKEIPTMPLDESSSDRS